MPKATGKAARLTVSALAIALLLSGCSAENYSHEESSTVELDEQTVTDSQRAAASRLLLPSAIASLQTSSRPAASVLAASDSSSASERLEEASIALNPEGYYYLSDQLTLKTVEITSSSDLLTVLPAADSTRLVSRGDSAFEHQALLGVSYEYSELEELADSWRRVPEVESVELSRLFPLV